MFELSRIVRKNILNLKPYSSARDEFKGKEGVFLDANENPYGDLNRYPDPYQTELKQKLAEFKNVNQNQIFVGNGSDEVIDLAYRIFCEPGKDKALTFSPTYGMYDVSASINNVELIKIPLNSNFQIDLDQLNPFLTDSAVKIIFICSPNNPTGNDIKRSDIEFILANFNGIVIVDEAYIDFSKSSSCLNLLSSYKNLIVSQTFSKAWGLAAARVGIAYAHSDIITLYNQVKPPYNVSSLNQTAALSALDNYEEFTSNLSAILSEKEKLTQALTKLPIIKKIYPSEANFLLVEVANANEIYEKIVADKIIVRNRHNLVNNCIRITVGTADENKLLLKALKELK